MGRPKNIDRTQLTLREAQVFHLVAQGLSTPQIAARLGLSIKTVQSYTHNIKKRLHLPRGATLRACIQASLERQKGLK